MPRFTQEDTTAGSFSETVILLALASAMGVYIVPAHWSAIWADREFTGCVAAIANRIGEGQVLYSDQAHSPLPPLPFVLVYWLTRGQATWWWESFLNFVCQTTTVLVLYRLLSRYLPRPVPFVAALGTMPVFFSLAKVVLYDSSVQATVALMASAALSLTVPSSVGPDRRLREVGSTVWFRRIGWLSLATALSLLCKQSTAAGAALGAALLLLVLPASAPVSTRLRSIASYGVATVALVVALLVVLSPYANVTGFVVDVILTGSEPKGGAAMLVENFRRILENIGSYFTLGAFAEVGILVLLGARSLWRRADTSRQADGSGSGSRYLSVVGGFAGAIVGVVWLLSLPGPHGELPTYSPVFGFYPLHLLNLGLVLSVGSGIALLISSILRRFAPPVEVIALGALFAVTFPAALFHSLSVPAFRWTYDNNPLIFAALASVIFAVHCAVGGIFLGRSLARDLAVAVFVLVTEAALWTTLAAQMQAVSQCVDAWPEVRHLAGAKMTKSADAARQLVHLVRELAPQPTDSVLLLPEDPSFLAWFERPRPRLSSAIIFTDQYWERYVDGDYTHLASDPPKVIVIGPEPSATWVSKLWSHAAFQLIERIKRDLLPRSYRLAAVQPISLRGREENMLVYVRTEGEH
jgi:hypothetical protein